MTELMKQLQQWADEGRYDWENWTFNWEGVDKDGLWYTPNGTYPFGVEETVSLVLDGTIQVWRPVEHYPPPASGEVLALFRYDVVDEYEVVEVDDMDDEDPFTHWQPLPQPPQKGGEG